MSVRDRRVQYETAGLDRADLDSDPIVQWHAWYEQAASAGVAEPNAMTVSTVDQRTAPDSRVVLARAVDARGFVFYTNYDSAKSQQILVNPFASAVLHGLICIGKCVCVARYCVSRQVKVMSILRHDRVNLRLVRGPHPSLSR